MGSIFNNDVPGSSIPPITNNYTAIIDPTVTDDTAAGYEVGSQWVNNTTDSWFVCTDATNGAAVWQSVSAGGTSADLVSVDTSGFTGFLDATTDTSQKVFDKVDTLTDPLLFKGSITVAADFPTSAEVLNGWFYTILANVTDNDATKTNTGDSFVTNDEIAWNGTGWTVIGNAASITASNGLTRTGNDIKLGGSLTGYTLVGGTTNDETLNFMNGDSGLYKNIMSIGSTGADTTLHAWDYNNDWHSELRLHYILGMQLRMTDDVTADYAGLKIPPGVTDYITVEHTNTAFTGLMYSSDISANYSNRSIPDVEYVDGLVSALTASNGLTRTLDDFELGGTLTGATVVAKDSNKMTFNGHGDFEVFTGVMASTITSYLGTNSTSSGFGSFSAAGLNSGVNISTSQMTIVDQNNSKGFQYSNDYSANFTDRSLIDFGAFKSYMGEGLTWDGSEVDIGGTITTDKTIAMSSGSSFNFDMTSGSTFYAGANLGLGNPTVMISAEIDNTFAQSDLAASFSGSSRAGIQNYAEVSEATIYFDVAFGGDSGSALMKAYGFEYGGDYSGRSGVTDRWIPDKGYVTGLAGNGLTYDGSNKINLGTTALTADVEIYGDSGNYYFDLEDLSAFYAFATDGSFESSISADNTGFQLVHNNGTNQYGLYLNPTSGYLVEDNINNKGMIYAGDYESNFTARSLATKQYIDNSLSVRNITTVNTATYDLLVSDYILHVTYTATAAVTSLTLPTAQVVAGRKITIKDAGGSAGTNNITIDTEGAQTIDGAATAVINGNYDYITLYCDGSNWFII